VEKSRLTICQISDSHTYKIMRKSFKSICKKCVKNSSKTLFSKILFFSFRYFLGRSIETSDYICIRDILYYI